MRSFRIIILFFVFTVFFTERSFSQNDASVSGRVDATLIAVGDQVKFFIEVKNPGNGVLQWAVIPDSFNSLEVVERGKIDTTKQGNSTVYKQRVLITGFDSGAFKVPPFVFSVIPKSGSAYTIQTDSFILNVSTIAVDTTKAFRGIKNIIAVKSDWRDYIWWIVGGVVVLFLIIFLVRHFTKKKPVPVVLPATPAETLQQRTLRLLGELESRKLWQQGNIKLYYSELTDILRGYIEERFKTPAMELTTDELLSKSHDHREMSEHYDELAQILHTADLAKFAKAQPLPFEHTQTLEQTKQFVIATKSVIVETNINPS